MMGKPTGFLELPRQSEPTEERTQRVKHFREFVLPLAEQDAKQQGARCMDCGIPYCMTGCPLNNLIPDWNDLVYQSDWKAALDQLHATNNFPEFTARLCPAPCEEACTLNIHSTPVGIKSIERAIIDRGWQEDWIKPHINPTKTGKRVAVVGSGPAGLACAQQLARAGHHVTVYEKNAEIGGLLRYGIPDFKLEKRQIDRRVEQMRAEGVVFQTGVCIGETTASPGVTNHAARHLAAEHLVKSYDALVLAGGAEQARDLSIPGRDLHGIHLAMEFLTQQNQANAGSLSTESITAHGKHVVVIGGGDTGSDCVGTSIRQGASSVTQLELLPMPPSIGQGNPVWPAWPVKLRTSSSQEEGAQRDWSITTQAFLGSQGQVKKLEAMRLQWVTDPSTGQMTMQEVPQSKFTLPAELVLLAMGFAHPIRHGLLAELGVELDRRGNVLAKEEGEPGFQTSRPGVFATGDMRRGQSLIVWAIREGRRCARAVDSYLMQRAFLSD